MIFNRKFESFKKTGVPKSGIERNRSHREAGGMWISGQTRSDGQLHLEIEQLLFSGTSSCLPRIVSWFYMTKILNVGLFLWLISFEYSISRFSGDVFFRILYRILEGFFDILSQLLFCNYMSGFFEVICDCVWHVRVFFLYFREML